MSKIIVDGEVMELPDSGGINFTIDKTLTMSEDNVLGVAVPTKGVTKEEFDQMSDDEKKGHIIVTDEPPFAPVGIFLQEYDAEIDSCNWHVRKYSNGYCELTGRKKFVGMDFTRASNSITGLYLSPSEPEISFTFPLELVKNYSEIISASCKDSTVWCTRIREPSLLHTAPIGICTTGSKTNQTVFVDISVSGRWKE